MKRIPIRVHTANALKWLGTLYRTPADALKEHISNAIDEHVKATQEATARPTLRVVFTMSKSGIQIDYPYGMSEKECEDILQRVANSQKQQAGVDQIGRLGIGLFSFMQVGTRCVLHSRKAPSDHTFKLTLKEGQESAACEKCSKHESLVTPGISISISGLRGALNPLKATGPLSHGMLEKAFASRFDSHLRSGLLSIVIRVGEKEYAVRPEEITLPGLAKTYGTFSLPKEHRKTATLDLYWHPGGKGIVKICHMGVAVVDDLKALSAYGLEESVYASGDVTGTINADFLTPLPSRTGFEENAEWMTLLDWLDRIRGSIEEEVDAYKRAQADKKLTEIQRKAIELAREILSDKVFEGLEFLDGIGRKAKEPLLPVHGFDFVPDSRRIEAGQAFSLILKALVPARVPEGTTVSVSASSDEIELLEGTYSVRAQNADTMGIVALSIPGRALRSTIDPVLVVAEAGGLRTEARVRVAPRIQTRNVEQPGQKGPRFSYLEINFEEGPERHSRFSQSTGVIEINQLNPDFREETNRDDEARLGYAALMIGKETLVHNDPSMMSDDLLEKMLTFHFRLKQAIPAALKKPRGRPRKPR